MLNTIQFNQLSCIALDFVDDADGFLYLRMAGPETAVGAIWARLSARDARRKSKYGSDVQIPDKKNAHHPHYVSTQPGIRYRTLRTRLPSGLVDLVMIHPLLTVAENQGDFQLLTYQGDVPNSFFSRLNSSLPLPLKAEWASWLWQQGQQSQSWLMLEPKTIYEGRKPVKTTALTEASHTPIYRLDTQVGRVHCYRVRVDGPYKSAWLKIIRSHLGLAISLKKKSPPAEDHYYSSDGHWTVYIAPAIYAADKERLWTLQREGQVVLPKAPSLNWLLSQARDTLGVHFVVKEANNV